MGLMDLIRKAEEQSLNAARRGRELARSTLNESGRMLRRKMRVNPAVNSTKEAATNAVPTQSSGIGSGDAASPHPTGRRQETCKRIISINGKDVRTEEVPAPERRRSA
jgi:hypothetical protein